MLKRWAVLGTASLALVACSPSASDDGTDALTERTSSSSDDTDALTERTCEIFRDISADAANDVDTLSETRDRFRDLLNGYGQAAPADVASALQDVVAALTNVDVDALEIAIGRLDDACSSRGF
jgi:uncharacterized protein YPO0396